MAWIAAIILVGLATALVLPRVRSARGRRRQVLFEDALKQIWGARQEGRPLTSSELGGRLGLSPRRTLNLIQGLESAGYVRSHAGALELTEAGEQLGLHVLRGHRLWERYLSDEMQRPLAALHGEAERAEHRLTPEDVEALADHLGHPRFDPHGDVIPPAAGPVPEQPSTPLTDWPRERPARIVHVEDEPAASFAEALGAGLVPGAVVCVTAKDASGITVETAGGPRTVSPAVAARIDVREASEREVHRPPPVTLAMLPTGGAAEVAGLRDGCTGLMRRRLLDLGFTPGAEVAATLANVGAEARAYEIRGTVIALRRDQADQIVIRPAEPAARDGAAR
jgi:DtxR family Mn-dependent transcriptional regulator